jgi:hypothetical protein
MKLWCPEFKVGGTDVGALTPELHRRVVPVAGLEPAAAPL